MTGSGSDPGPAAVGRRQGFLAAQRVPIGVVVIGGAFIVGGLDLGFPAGRFPVMLGSVTVALAVLEIIGKLVFGAGRQPRPGKALFSRVELGAIGWIYFTLAAIFLLGMLIGAFLSTFVFTLLIERRSLMMATAISSSMTFMIWFLFAYLANFEMYSGFIL